MKKKLSIVLAVVLTATLLLTSGVFAGTISEDFEWGYDGVSLEDWDDYGGDVAWKVHSASGGVAEIDTVPARPGGTGTRSARICRGTSGGFAYAYYYLKHPYEISFWVKKSDKAYVSVYNGDGSTNLNVHIDTLEKVKYYNGSRWIIVCSLPSHVEAWYHIVLKNINWVTDKYDIYVYDANDVFLDKETGVNMRSGIWYKNYVYFGHRYGSQQFWIDDITTKS